jgi:hypothetical protein
MGQRANYVLIRDGQALAFQDQWGALGCVYQFATGPKGASRALVLMERTEELMDWGFAEGGYLIDFDEKRAIVFGYPSDDLLDWAETSEIDGLAEMVSEAVRESSAIDRALEEGPLQFLETIAPQWAGWHLQWDDRGVDAFADYLSGRSLSSPRTQPPGARERGQRASLQA